MNNLNQSVYTTGKKGWLGDVPTIEDSSWVTYNYYRLFKIPFNEYQPQDIRFMLTQETCIDVLAPLAIGILEREGAFFEAENYEGDLLLSVMRLEEAYWKLNSLQRQRITNLLVQNEHLYDHRRAFAEVVGLKEIREEFKELIVKFK